MFVECVFGIDVFKKCLDGFFFLMREEFKSSIDQKLLDVFVVCVLMFKLELVVVEVIGGYECVFVCVFVVVEVFCVVVNLCQVRDFV